MEQWNFKLNIFMLLKACFFYVCVFLISVQAIADQGDTKAVKPTAKNHPLKELRSGYHFSGKDIQAMQDNKVQNPGWAWAQYGKKLWSLEQGPNKKSCSSCHNKASASMKGIATRYPLFYEPEKRLINLSDRINLCRRKFLKVFPYEEHSNELLGLSIYVKSQSVGLPVNVKVSGPATKSFEAGKKIYYTPRGQLNMSCANCHENNVGKLFRGTKLSQGHSNGYPAFRLTWQKPGSLNQRINSCNTLIRAKPYGDFSEDYKALELYLAWRGQGLQIETPAVRK